MHKFKARGQLNIFFFLTTNVSIVVVVVVVKMFKVWFNGNPIKRLKIYKMALKSKALFIPNPTL